MLRDRSGSTPLSVASFFAENDNGIVLMLEILLKKSAKFLDLLLIVSVLHIFGFSVTPSFLL